MGMSTSFHMRPSTTVETDRHGDNVGGYVRLSLEDSSYSGVSIHGNPADLRRLADAANKLAEECERYQKALAMALEGA